MDADARRKHKPIAKLLDAAKLDLDAAMRLLTDPPNILAANHLQQAAEKILGAVRLHRGLLNTKDHDLVILIDGRPEGEPRPLPVGDPWRDRFRPLEALSAYATTFRYSLTPTPKVDELRGMLKTLTGLHGRFLRVRRPRRLSWLAISETERSCTINSIICTRVSRSSGSSSRRWQSDATRSP